MPRSKEVGILARWRYYRKLMAWDWWRAGHREAWRVAGEQTRKVRHP